MSVSPPHPSSSRAEPSSYRDRSPHRSQAGSPLHPPARPEHDAPPREKELGIPSNRHPKVAAFIASIPSLNFNQLCQRMPPSLDFGTENVLDKEVIQAIIQRLPKARERCPYPHMLSDTGLTQKLMQSLRYIHPTCQTLPITEQYILTLIDHLKSVEHSSRVKVLQHHSVLNAISTGLASLPHSPARQTLFELMVSNCEPLTDPPHPDIIRNHLCLLKNMPTSAASEQLLAKLTGFIRRIPPNTFLSDLPIFKNASEIPRTQQSDALQDALIDNLIPKRNLTLEQLSSILASLRHRTSADQSSFTALWNLFYQKLHTTPTNRITSAEFKHIARTLSSFVEPPPQMNACMKKLATHLQNVAPQALDNDDVIVMMRFLRKLPLNNPEAPSSNEPIATIIQALLPHLHLYPSPPTDAETLTQTPITILQGLRSHANLPVCRDVLQKITQALHSIQAPISHGRPYESVGKMLYALRPFLSAHPQEALTLINAFCAVCKYPAFTADELRTTTFNQTLKAVFSPLIATRVHQINLHGFFYELASWLLSQRLQQFVSTPQEQDLRIVCGLGRHKTQNRGKMATIVEQQLANHCDGQIIVRTNSNKAECTITKPASRQHPPKNPDDMTLENHAAVLAEKQKPLMVQGKTIESRFNRQGLLERREVVEEPYRHRRHDRPR